MIENGFNALRRQLCLVQAMFYIYYLLLQLCIVVLLILLKFGLALNNTFVMIYLIDFND